MDRTSDHKIIGRRKTSPRKQMGGGAPGSDRQHGLNPNWAQLQQKIRQNTPSHRRYTIPITSSERPAETVLGKRKDRSDSELDGQPEVTVLNPVSDDCSVTDVLAMDCEMVGVGIDGSKSALARVTLVNAWGNVIYDEFVRPLEYVVDFRTEVSGIRPWKLRKAKDFSTVQKKVSDLIKGRILVGHALHNDLKVLLLSHPKKDIRDTSEYQPFQREGRRSALRHLAAQILGVKIQQGEHCPIEDARAVMLIYQKNRKDWEKSRKQKVRLKQKLSKHRNKKHTDTHSSEP